MNAMQIVLRTVVTTIDLLLTLALFKADNTTNEMRKYFTVVMLLNLMGVWI